MLKTDRIIALDIGASKLVLAEFSIDRSGVPVLLNYGIGSLNIDPENETDASAYIVSTIRDLMAQHGIAPAPLYMTMSGQAVFPRYTKLPPVAKDKIEQIIRYEAEQNVPFPIDEVVWDYQLMSESAGGEDLNAMLVAVKIENITRLTNCVLAAGLEPEVVDVAPMALYNAVRYNYPNLQGCTMVLDIGARSSNLIFIEQSKIYSRSIPVAGNAITTDIMKEFEIPYKEAEALKLAHAFVAFGGVYAGPENETADRVSKVVRNVITRLHAEVNRTINFYRSQQGGQPPSLVLLAGGTSIIPHTDTFFREKLKVNVEHMNPLANVIVSEGLNQERVEGDLHVMGEVAGLALRRALTCPVELNLMPPELISRKAFQRRQPFFILAAVGMVLTMLCWWVYFHRMSGMFQTRQELIEQRCLDFKKQAGQMTQVSAEREVAQKRVGDILGVIQRRTVWLEMLQTIHDAMLDGMWLTSLAPVVNEKDRTIGAVQITGKGFLDRLSSAAVGDRGPIVVFRERLGRSRYFVEGAGSGPADTQDFKRDQGIWEIKMMVVLKEPLRLD